ncbi:type II CRISPR RNA-guided endonuclease Cas9 [Bordetella sp. FB-8]|uniref:type II CRISPR RNA-guided endonuclease Cas9 n=1 Tax=Bordetella sp. FB-8 TaxID=1159870 RepID=UPI00036608D7|nr:type II CRISPR RNA-guided endonuclease Cas9 [Bordetella sp. FB-8]
MADKPWTINLGPLTFGFDIGVASVGWCVLGTSRIIDLGVRCFDKAETADRGESLNLARRTARLMRRRLRRRAWRLTKLVRLLNQAGLIDDTQALQRPAETSPWQLRVEGLDRKLDPNEWARVLYHLCKHRGFHWISKAEQKKAESDSAEGGRVKQGLADTKHRMSEKNYRSAAEMVLTEFPEAQRNKQGEYNKALSRLLLGDELILLFERQREYGNPHATPDLEARIAGNGDRKSGLFWEQKPPLSGNDLLKMLGHCTFEKSEYRAPKASYAAERHVWLTRLNNLRIIIDGNARPLNEAERQAALPLPYKQVGDFTYKQLKSALIKHGLIPDDTKFAGLSYPIQQGESKTKDPESERLIRLPAWQELRKVLKDAALETEWQSIASQPDLLDQIAWTLSVFKDGDEVERELRKLPLPGAERMIEALSGISFDKFHNLSFKALRKIVPHMEAGLRYDEACVQAGYHHSQLFKTGEGQNKFLPPFYSGRDKDGRMVFDDKEDIPRNPVVLRSLNQARKVLNALVRKYGSPSAVHIEMARDLSRPMDERSKVKKAQDEFRERNEKDKLRFAEDFKIPAKGREFEKYQLYREQHGKCAYSLEALDLDSVLQEPGYAEVDHVLPYSRSYDDSKNNKVLVLSRENRNKGNRTPYEYLDGENDSARWHTFVAYVEGNKSYRLAKRSRLLRKNFGKEESRDFMERNLNDTRYICKFFKNYVERHLQLAEGGDKRCVVLSGQLTSFLRTRWGLIKVRSDSDRHHALDAAVIAACGHGLVKRLSDYSRRKELEQAGNVIDIETGEIRDSVLLAKLQQHFPKPWEFFREELLIRLNQDNLTLLRDEAERLAYPREARDALRPLFVSRAPQRRNSGAAHKDTIYRKAPTKDAPQRVTEKVKLSDLTLKDMEKLSDPHRNEKLYAAIRARLEAHGGKGEKAFPPNNPLYKPDREGNPTGPIVRTVTMVNEKLSGIPIRGGVAKNDTMLRVDFFRHKKDGKYHLVPVYVHHVVAKELPNRAIVAYKDEGEWTPIDEQNFDFEFSLHPNDFLRVSLKNETQQGYFAGCDRSTGAIGLWAHDRNVAIGKDGLIRGVGVKTALHVEKFHIDILGNIYPAPPEKRRGLA